MSKNLVCWKCGLGLVDLILPMSRREECSACEADQHVCRLCKHYAGQLANQCREDRAEFIADKERANFCDYFAPKTGAYQPKDVAGSRQARAQLAELFADESAADEPINEAQNPQLTTEAAQSELEKLFGGGDN